MAALLPKVKQLLFTATGISYCILLWPQRALLNATTTSSIWVPELFCRIGYCDIAVAPHCNCMPWPGTPAVSSIPPPNASTVSFMSNKGRHRKPVAQAGRLPCAACPVCHEPAQGRTLPSLPCAACLDTWAQDRQRHRSHPRPEVPKPALAQVTSTTVPSPTRCSGMAPADGESKRSHAGVP